MEVLLKDSEITKWQQNHDNFRGVLLDGEKPAFILYPHHPEIKTIFTVKANIYITNEITDFILDVDIITNLRLDIDGNMPTKKELYEAYCFAQLEWNALIFKRSIDEGILIERKLPPHAFEKLEPYFQKCLDINYPLN